MTTWHSAPLRATVRSKVSTSMRGKRAYTQPINALRDSVRTWDFLPASLLEKTASQLYSPWEELRYEALDVLCNYTARQLTQGEVQRLQLEDEVLETRRKWLTGNNSSSPPAPNKQRQARTYRAVLHALETSAAKRGELAWTRSVAFLNHPSPKTRYKALSFINVMLLLSLTVEKEADRGEHTIRALLSALAQQGVFQIVADTKNHPCTRSHRYQHQISQFENISAISSFNPQRHEDAISLFNLFPSSALSNRVSVGFLSDEDDQEDQEEATNTHQDRRPQPPSSVLSLTESISEEEGGYDSAVGLINAQKKPNNTSTKRKTRRRGNTEDWDKQENTMTSTASTSGKGQQSCHRGGNRLRHKRSWSWGAPFRIVDKSTLLKKKEENGASNEQNNKDEKKKEGNRRRGNAIKEYTTNNIKERQPPPHQQTLPTSSTTTAPITTSTANSKRKKKKEKRKKAKVGGKGSVQQGLRLSPFSVSNDAINYRTFFEAEERREVEETRRAWLKDRERTRLRMQAEMKEAEELGQASLRRRSHHLERFFGESHVNWDVLQRNPELAANQFATQPPHVKLFKLNRLFGGGVPPLHSPSASPSDSASSSPPTSSSPPPTASSAPSSSSSSPSFSLMKTLFGGGSGKGAGGAGEREGQSPSPPIDHSGGNAAVHRYDEDEDDRYRRTSVDIQKDSFPLYSSSSQCSSASASEDEAELRKVEVEKAGNNAEGWEEEEAEQHEEEEEEEQRQRQEEQDERRRNLRLARFFGARVDEARVTEPRRVPDGSPSLIATSSNHLSKG
ncbi:hypothetical protein QOT17_000790 [Balamuthia mandrillaris]